MDRVVNRAKATGIRVREMLYLVLAGCLAIVGAANANQVGYVFITVDCPGAVGNSDVLGLNNVGSIVGTCVSFAGGGYKAARQPDGTFAFTPLPVAPNGLPVTPAGINDSGTIVGEMDAPDGSYSVGFILKNLTYTLVSHPSFAFTFLRSINAAGLMTGYAINRDGAGNAIGGVGFIYDPTTAVFTDISIPNTTEVLVQGINTAGQVVGNGQLSIGGQIAFLRDPSSGLLTYFAFPSGKNHTHPRAITDAGQIGGFTADPALDTEAAFVGSLASGFQFFHATGFDPTTTDTFANGLNNSGEMSGFTQSEVDASTDGFLILPLPTTKDQCKKGGWQPYGIFKNQGDCVSYVATGGKNPP